MNFLIDMNLSPRWCGYFKENGHSVIHWSEAGLTSAEDSEIFNYARDYGYIIFTHDLDFSVLLAYTNLKGPSVVQLRTPDTLPENIHGSVMKAIADHSSELTCGAIVTVDLFKARVRILPIHKELDEK